MSLDTPEFTDLSNRVSALEDALAKFESPIATFLNSLGVEQIEVTKPIPVTIRQDGDEFIASFLDANLSTAGDTPSDAIGNLQSLIADCFEDLERHPDDALGKSMAKQKRVLMEVLCRKS